MQIDDSLTTGESKMRRTAMIILLTFTVFFVCSVSLAQEIPDILTYSQLSHYKELYEPDMDSSDKYGKNIVRIEAVIGPVTQDDDGEYCFTMWIKDNEGYYPYQQKVMKYLENTHFPEMPSYGQRIIYDILPTEYGRIEGSQIQAWEVIEENVDVLTIADEYAAIRTIPYEDLIRYKELYEPEMVDYLAGKHTVYIDTIIGRGDYDKKERNYTFDLWIKGNSGYYRVTQKGPFPVKPELGQRVIYGVTVYSDGSFVAKHVWDTLVIDEGIDITLIEENGIETDPVEKLLRSPFDESNFVSDFSYKKILRNPEEYDLMPITLEGTYLQNLKNGHYLVSADKYYYCLDIKPDVLDFNMLEDDRLLIYGYVSGTYTYSTLMGDKTVPKLQVKKVVLLEDE